IDGTLPRPCLYYDLHACLGPCVAGLTTKAAYDEAVRDVVLFLQGRNRELLASLEKKMGQASAEENFEMAAAYRDALRTVVDVSDPELLEAFLAARRGARVSVRAPRRGAARERVELAQDNARERHKVRFRRMGGEGALGVERLARVLDLPVPPRRIEAFDISHLQGTDSIASLVVFEDGKPKKSDYRLFGIASQSLLAPDDFRSMAEAVERRYRRLRDEGAALPDLVLVDGGRGQLQAALTALDRLGIEIPAVGLAKREEEIWVPGRPDPIRLP